MYLSINSIAQSIHHTAKQLLTNRNIHNGTSSLHNITLLDQLVITKHHNSNVVRLQVQRHALIENVQLVKSILLLQHIT